jgi:hypothetical protein
MDQNDSNKTTSDLIAQIKEDKGKLEDKFDEYITYRDLIEKDILDLMGFSTLSDEKKKAMHERFSQMLENRVALKVLDGLSEEDREIYKKMLEEGKDEESYKFILDKGVDPMEIMSVEAIMLKVEMYLDSKVVRGEAQKKFDEKISGEKNQNGS